MPTVAQSGDDKLPYSILGRKFKSSVDAEAHFTQVKARREKLAGRALSDLEVYLGVAKEDTRTSREKAKDSSFRVDEAKEETDSNPYRSKAWIDRHDSNRPESPSKRQKRLEKEWDAKQAEAERQAAMANDPARQALVANAEAAWEFAAFSPGTSYADVVHTEQLLKVARQGSLDRAKEMAAALNTKVETDYSSARTAAEQRLLAAKAEFEAIPVPPNVNPFLMPGDTVGRLDDGRIEVLSAQREGEVGRRVRHYTPETAPPEILAAVGEN